MPKIGHYEAVCAEIIRLLCEERDQRGLSNYAISQRSGVSQSMISLVERRLRNPSMELMLKIADAVGADLAVLITKAQRSVSKKRV